MAEKHVFDIGIAKKYGLTCAVILENIHFWIEKNRANKTNFHDGKYWTFNSMENLKEVFPYLEHHQIRFAIDKLRSEGVLLIGNYNKLKMDRTLWYTLTDEGAQLFEDAQTVEISHLRKTANAFEKNSKCIGENSQMDLRKSANAFEKNSKPIPDINTYKKPIINADVYANDPTMEKIKDFVSSRKLTVDAEDFYYYWLGLEDRHNKSWRVELCNVAQREANNGAAKSTVNKNGI